MSRESAFPGPCSGTRSPAESWGCSVQQVQEYRAGGGGERGVGAGVRCSCPSWGWQQEKAELWEQSH